MNSVLSRTRSRQKKRLCSNHSARTFASVSVFSSRRRLCFLAVLVLALGICGVTTQFTVVNAFVLRGFSFPHPEQLVSVGLIDPQATAQNNNFGAGNIPSAQDYEDLRAAQHRSR